MDTMGRQSRVTEGGCRLNLPGVPCKLSVDSRCRLLPGKSKVLATVKPQVDNDTSRSWREDRSQSLAKVGLNCYNLIRISAEVD